jgi:hypothetical protein
MDAGATLESAGNVSQAARNYFFDRYHGVIVTESAAFGHPTTQRLYRRTFTVAAKNFYVAAVVLSPRIVDWCAHAVGLQLRRRIRDEQRLELCRIRHLGVELERDALGAENDRHPIVY